MTRFPCMRAVLSVACAALVLVGCDSLGLDTPPAPEEGVQPWAAMLDAVNDLRQRGTTCGNQRMEPVPALVWDSRLEAAAERHTADMAARGRLSHQGSDGRDLGERVQSAGYRWRTVGENIARGHRSVPEVMEGWAASPGHCRQMMSPAYAELGAATTGGYWTQVFASPR